MAESSPDKTRTVADIMSRPVVTVSPDDKMAEAAATMREHRVGSVVAVDQLRPVGILTERDLVRFTASGGDAGAAVVSEWMTTAPDSVGPDVDVVAAFASLSEHGYRHIPVVEADELVGIVSMRDLMRIAQIQPAENLAHEIPRGLEGVVVAETDIGDVRGLEGFYHYRQYSAVDLAESRTLEDVWHLMFEGALPSLAERAEFAARIAPLRAIPAPVAAALPEVARLGTDAPPLDMLRTTISLLGAHLGFRPSLDVDAAQLRQDAMRVCAVVPTFLTAIHRIQHGLEPIEPDPELAYAANYLYMLNGTVPEPDHARAVEQYLISTIDHGFNASTFTARVVASTGADVGACVVAAIGALSGPLHGGAPSRALDLVDEIGSADRIDAVIRARLDAGERIMGFGHAVYRTADPRAVMLRRLAAELATTDEERAFVELVGQVERRVLELLEERKPGRALNANVELYAGVVMSLCGIPREMFTPTFAASRVVGWSAHILEQSTETAIIRPSARYVGPEPPQPVPLAS